MNSPAFSFRAPYCPSLSRALAAVHDADAQLLGLHIPGQDNLSKAMEQHRKAAAILNRYLIVLEAR